MEALPVLADVGVEGVVVGGAMDSGGVVILRMLVEGWCWWRWVLLVRRDDFGE